MDLIEKLLSDLRKEDIFAKLSVEFERDAACYVARICVDEGTLLDCQGDRYLYATGDYMEEAIDDLEEIILNSLPDSDEDYER